MTNSSFASSLAILSIDYTITTTCAAVLRSIVEDVALGSTLSAQSSSLNTINQHKATIAALSTALHEQEFLHTTATSTITTLLAHIVSLSIPPPTPLPTTLATSPSNDEMWMGLLQEKEEEINNLRQQIADPPPPQPATPPTPAPVDSPPPPLPTTTFTTLTDPTLFTIFGYLDAPDVLAAAAVDRTFFSRVDVMFGINSSINSPQKSRPQTPTTTKAKVAPTSAGGSSLLSRGFSTLTATVNSKLATRTPNPPSTATPDVSMFATSIADKLTAVELKSIIALTDKLRQKDGEIKLVTTENEDLLAKFEGSETVKAFMVDKVKELEVRNESIVGNIMQLQQQIESDKEVIGFVDCRVKELEKANSSLTARTSTAETLLDKVKSDKSKQLKVLEDMLQFERTSFKNSEASYKTTKKALVREVKQGRAMMEQLKEEVERERREAERGNDRRSSVGLGFN